MLRPFLRFLWIGVLLFAVDRQFLREEPGPVPVVIPAERVEELSTAFRLRAGRGPTSQELSSLLRSEVDDELLYRRALAQGFDRDDPVVARRLVQNMRFAGGDPEAPPETLYAEALELGMDKSDPVVRRRMVQRMRLAVESLALAEPPDDTALRAHYEATRERHVDPAQVRFVQLFFDGDPEGEAAAGLGALRTSGAGEAPPRDLGDAFLHGTRQPLQSHRELAARFGSEFAGEVFTLPEGVWSGPVASSYGEHLVFVQETTPERQRSFEEVRESVADSLLIERRRGVLEEWLSDLREEVPVVVAGSEAP